MYQGQYNGSSKHAPDLSAVLDRSWSSGIDKMMITGGSLSDSRAALQMAQTHESRLFSTVGCHPTRCSEFNEHEGGAEDYLEGLKALIKENPDKVVAFGEIGLDFDRLKFCDKETQIK